MIGRTRTARQESPPPQPQRQWTIQVTAVVVHVQVVVVVLVVVVGTKVEYSSHHCPVVSDQWRVYCAPRISYHIIKCIGGPLSTWRPIWPPCPYRSTTCTFVIPTRVKMFHKIPLTRICTSNGSRNKWNGNSGRSIVSYDYSCSSFRPMYYHRYVISWVRVHFGSLPCPTPVPVWSGPVNDCWDPTFWWPVMGRCRTNRPYPIPFGTVPVPFLVYSLRVRSLPRDVGMTVSANIWYCDSI